MGNGGFDVSHAGLRFCGFYAVHFSTKLCEKPRFDGRTLGKSGRKGYNSDVFRRFSVKIPHQIALLNVFLWRMAPMAHNFTSENKILQQN